MAGQLATVQHWYRSIGDANIERYPPFAVLRCWEKVVTGDMTEGARWAAVVDAASFDGVPDGWLGLLRLGPRHVAGWHVCQPARSR